MNLNEINSIKQYNKLLNQLNPFGKFQKKITAITLLFWIFSGVVRSIFNKEVLFNINEELPFLTLSIIAGLFSAPYLANYYNRRTTIIVLAAIYSVGALVLLVCPQDAALKCAIYMVSFSQYSICVCASCVVFEYVDQKLIPTLTWAFVFSYHLAKFSSILVFTQITGNPNEKFILSSVVLGFGLLSVGGSLFFKQSLRYLIDNDISHAQMLALQISQENNNTDEGILNIIEGSFIWSKVNIRKYGIQCFKKYKSLARETYYLGLSFFCLGIFSKFALVIFQLNERKKNVLFEHEVQLLWISIFQLAGLVSGIFFYKVFPRRKACLIISIVALVFTLILVILVRLITIPHFLVAAFSLLGLNSYLGSLLFFFMFLQAVEFYPHTIRTLAISLCFCFYYLGQLAFNLHFYFINDEQSSIQLVFCCSLSMILHLFYITQTFGKDIQYDIKQIQERENNED